MINDPISASVEAIADPAIPNFKTYQPEISAEPDKDLVFIIPTKKARSARKGNENKSPKLRQSR